jgi:hypothetical protein
VKNPPLLRVQSFNDPDTWHEIDRVEHTCTCEWFRQDGYCKHLEVVGVYQSAEFTPRTHPTFSQALSGMVKAIRMGRTEDAIYWLMYLDTMPATPKLSRKDARFRIARRLLIGSAEDGHSVEVMEKVSSTFPRLAQEFTPILALATEIVRICKLPNWWHTASGGQDYIYTSLVAQRIWVLRSRLRDISTLMAALASGVEARDKIKVAGACDGLCEAKLARTKLAEFLLQLAEVQNSKVAARLARIHRTHKSALSGDNNFLCQAAWVMAGGESPVFNTCEPVTHAEVVALLEQASERWKNPVPIPHEYCDGIHCAGQDRRYAGILQDMWAVCQVFNKHGNIEPNNEWTFDMYSLDGLEIEEIEKPVGAGTRVQSIAPPSLQSGNGDQRALFS